MKLLHNLVLILAGVMEFVCVWNAGLALGGGTGEEQLWLLRAVFFLGVAIESRVALMGLEKQGK